MLSVSVAVLKLKPIKILVLRSSHIKFFSPPPVLTVSRLKMKNGIIFAVLLILFGFKSYELLVSAAGKPKSCQSVMQGLMKMQMSVMMNCTKRMKFKNGKEKAKKMNCILRCALMTVGILDEDGQLQIGQTDYFLHKFFPDELIEKANSSLMPCANSETGEPLLFQSPEEDEFCVSYDGFIKCMLRQMPNLCQ